MKALRWGVLSTGVIARNFAVTAKAMGDEVILHAVASRSMEKAAAFADEFGIEKRYDSYEALAADPDVDIVYVATPHSRHYEDMKQLIAAGKNILCEKSFTVNAMQAQEIYELAKKKGVFVMEAFWTKLIPLYREVEAWIASGAIGEIRALTAQYGYTTAREARKFDAQLAGGTLLDIGVYAIGFACMMMGYSFDDVQSQLIMNEQKTDAVDAILLRRGGAVAQLTCAIGSYMPLHAAVYGTKGRIDIPEFKNPQSAALYVDGQEPVIINRPFDVKGVEYELREAMACVRDGKRESSLMTAEQSIAVMRMMDEIRRQNGMRFPFEK